MCCGECLKTGVIWGGAVGGEKPFTREINSLNSEVPLLASRNSVMVLLIGIKIGTDMKTGGKLPSLFACSI
jgi:hypothetical protein